MEDLCDSHLIFLVDVYLIVFNQGFVSKNELILELKLKTWMIFYFFAMLCITYKELYLYPALCPM